jgi:hypothetical protein
LGAAFNGAPACGPRPIAGGRDVLVRFFPGAWGEFEWECVELTMRFMYLTYGIAPYPANGSQVVWNYPGSALVKIANPSPGVAPVPGDVLSYGSTSTFGHSSIVASAQVDGAGNGSLTVVEQNNSATGSGRLTVHSWQVTGGPYTITGWLHSRR